MLRRPIEGLSFIAEAAQTIEATEERANEAELYRVQGDLLKAMGERIAAERSYCQALTVSERQNARLLQLRASTNLAHLWRDQGRIADARNLVAQIYAWFTEGFDAPDLIEAKALLDELGARKGGGL